MQPTGGSAVTCAQCGRTIPGDADEVARWRPREILSGGEVDELTAEMLLCPDCAREDRLGEYEAGEAD